MKWRNFPPQPRNMRTRAENIIMHLPGPIGAAKSASIEINCFDLFFNDQIINLIVTCTNIYIDNIKDAYDRERDANHTSIDKNKRKRTSWHQRTI